MNHFDYRDGVLHAEDVAIPDIAAQVGTPFYCYSTATLTRHYRVFAQAFAGLDALVCYAMKANSNQAVLRTLAKLGSGADVVSEGELRRALAAGIPAGKILFSGVGKTAREMDFALAAGILCFNVESEPELELLSARAAALGKVAPISLRINPDVDARTHKKISTGKAENKFGIPWQRARQVYARAATLPGIRITGIDTHIGSQITELQPFQGLRRIGRQKRCDLTSGCSRDLLGAFALGGAGDVVLAVADCGLCRCIVARPALADIYRDRAGQHARHQGGEDQAWGREESVTVCHFLKTAPKHGL